MSATGIGEHWSEDTRGLRFITYLSPSIQRTLFEELADHCRRWPGHEMASLQVETRVSGPERGVADPFSIDETGAGFVCSPSYLWLRELEPSPVELLGVAPVFRDGRKGCRPVYSCDVISQSESATPRSVRAESAVVRRRASRPHTRKNVVQRGGPRMIRVYAAGENAVAVVENGSVELVLEGRGARYLAVDPRDPDIVYAGTSDEGLLKSVDGGGSWEELSGIDHPRITAVAVSSADGALYAGTEPSSLFSSRDGGASWRELEGLKNLPSSPTWSFPPRPWISYVRAIATGHSDSNLVVAGIELGGVVRSSDGGETWQDQRPGAYPDCHSITVHPAKPDVFYEAAGGGFAESEDRGESWRSADEGIERRYVWGLAVDREDPRLLYVSAASGPGAAHGRGFTDAAIYRRRGGTWVSWEPVLEDLAEFPYALAADPEISGGLYAGMGDGAVLHSPDAGESWSEVARVPPGLSALVAVEA